MLIRLTGLLDADADARALPSVTLEPGDDLDVRDLTVRLPDDQVLVPDLDLHLTAGDSLFVTGRSGTGKTTLLRSLADLWPYADGTMRRPLGGDALFLSQQPYVPLGTLRSALAYPGPAAGIDDARAAAVLTAVQLPHLVDQLDAETDWSRRLSPGEQQRLGFARVLLVRPRVAFLDETTSALDEGMERHALHAGARGAARHGDRQRRAPQHAQPDPLRAAGAAGRGPLAGRGAQPLTVGVLPVPGCAVPRTIRRRGASWKT